MKKKILIGISVFMYTAAFLLIYYYFNVEFSANYIMSPVNRVAVLLLSCLLMYPGKYCWRSSCPEATRAGL